MFKSRSFHPVVSVQTPGAWPRTEPDRMASSSGATSGSPGPLLIQGKAVSIPARAAAVPAPIGDTGRKTSERAATASSIARTRRDRSTCSASRRAPSGAIVIRSSVPSASLELTTSYETGVASVRASAASDWAAIPSMPMPRDSGRPSEASSERYRS